MLSVDRNIVQDNIPSLVSALSMMFGSYYCFNIAYPSELASTLEFVQRYVFFGIGFIQQFILLNCNKSKAAASVNWGLR